MPTRLYSTPVAMNVVLLPFHRYRFSFPASARTLPSLGCLVGRQHALGDEIHIGAVMGAERRDAQNVGVIARRSDREIVQFASARAFRQRALIQVRLARGRARVGRELAFVEEEDLQTIGGGRLEGAAAAGTRPTLFFVDLDGALPVDAIVEGAPVGEEDVRAVARDHTFVFGRTRFRRKRSGDRRAVRQHAHQPQRAFIPFIQVFDVVLRAFGQGRGLREDHVAESADAAWKCVSAGVTPGGVTLTSW